MQIHLFGDIPNPRLIIRQLDQFAGVFDGAVISDGAITIGNIGLPLVSEDNWGGTHRLAISIYYRDIAIFILVQVHIFHILLICRQFDQLAGVFNGAVVSNGAITIGNVGFSLVSKYDWGAAHGLTIPIHHGYGAIFVLMQIHVFNQLFVIGKLNQLTGIIDSAILCNCRFVARVSDIGFPLIFVHDWRAVHRIAILIYNGDVAILIFVQVPIGRLINFIIFSHTLFPNSLFLSIGSRQHTFFRF